MTSVISIQPPAAPKAPVGPTILGSELRRKTSAIVNGLSRGVFIDVKFHGTRAFTNGRRIVLPKIKDLAEIKYSTARALMGYAIHEVAHVRYTDFKAIERIFDDPKVVQAFGTDDKREIVQRQKLIKKFENCIEDYRIEREMTREYPGTKSDLEALRIAIHPRLNTLSTGWFADPRSCGPLALTWVGARINGFKNQHLEQTLSHVPVPVMRLIDDWTIRMTDVATTADAVDLAIQFELEAQDFAKATREAAAKQAEADEGERNTNPQDQDRSEDAGIEEPIRDVPEPETSEDGEQTAQSVDEPSEREASEEKAEQDGQTGEGSQPNGDEGLDGESDVGGGSGGSDGDSSSDGSDLPESEGDDDDRDSEDSTDGGNPKTDASKDGASDTSADEDRTGDSSQDPSAKDNHGDDANQAERSDEAGPTADTNADATSIGDAKDDPKASGAEDARDADQGPTDDRGDWKDADGPDSAQPDDDLKFGSDRREKQESSRQVEGQGPPRKTDRKRPVRDGEEGEVDLNGDLLDDYQDPQPGEATKEVPSDEEQDPVDEIESSADRTGDAPKEGEAAEVDSGPSLADSADDGMGSSAGAFDDVLEDDARRDDAISDAIEEMRDRLASGEPLPQMTPDGSDGEVDPTTLLGDITDANEEAPDYDSSDSDPDPNDHPEEVTRQQRGMQHYGDARFTLAPTWSGDGCRHAEMQQKAAGAVTTTARTIKRLLMAEEKSGFLTNRRSGEFDIRNVSAISRNTGTCYRRSWKTPAPRTLLVTLIDFSGSMDGDDDQIRDLDTPIAIAMTGALAIEQAVKGTSVNSAMYGFTGASPTVNMTVFKEGRQSEVLTKRRIGAFEKVDKLFTPTGEAMAAVAARMDNADEERRVLLVLTDGMADDMQLCADVTAVLRRRGIEVVVIGIQDDSAESWAPVHRTIRNLNELPAALLATIDPRAAKKGKRKMAA
jgi:hypothetical protein